MSLFGSLTTAEQLPGRHMGMKPLFLTSQRGLSEEKDSRLLLLLLFCKEKEKWTIKERKVRIRLFLSKK